MKIELDLAPEQVEQLRQVMDALPLNRYAPLVVSVLRALPRGLEPSLKRDAEILDCIRGGRIADLTKILRRIPHGASL
jgi:hypothetical protein